MLNASEDQVNQWRNQAGEHNPAGPLFVSGQFAESEIVSAANIVTAYNICSGRCGTLCSGSAHAECC